MALRAIKIVNSYSVNCLGVASWAELCTSTEKGRMATPLPSPYPLPCCHDCSTTSLDSQIAVEDLSCGNQFLCRKCLSRRMKQKIGLKCDCCPDMTQKTLILQPNEECKSGNDKVFIFMDHSNTWIEAKKFKPSRDYKEDSRVRLEAGNLLRLVTKDRELPDRPAKLYGSEPPPLDSVWDIYREKGWNITAPQRSSWTRKEKRVDTQLVADVTELVCNVNNGKHTIAIISGDEDVLPAVEKALEYDWKVEVYFWKNAMSAAIKKKAQVLVVYLDDHYDYICFTNRKFNPLPNSMPFIKANGIVIRLENKDKAKVNDYVIEMESITGLHARYFSLNKLSHFTEKKYEGLIVVVFDVQIVNFQLANVIGIYKIGKFPFIKQLNTFISVSRPGSSFHVEQQVEDETKDNENDLSGPFEPVGDQQKGEDETKDNKIDLSGSYELVSYCRKKKKKQLSSNFCQGGKYCRFGAKCKDRHSPEDQEYFRTHEPRKRLRKTQLCHGYSKGECRKHSQQCNFAHGEKDAVCTKCGQKGHLTKDCTLF